MGHLGVRVTSFATVWMDNFDTETHAESKTSARHALLADSTLDSTGPNASRMLLLYVRV